MLDLFAKHMLADAKVLDEDEKTGAKRYRYIKIGGGVLFERPEWPKVGMASLVSAHRPHNRRLKLESGESVVMGAGVCCDGRGLPGKRSPVWAGPLLRNRTFVPSRGHLRCHVGIRDRAAASGRVSARGLRRLLPCSVCRDSVGQVPQGQRLGTGVYFYRMDAGSWRSQPKVVFLER